MAPTGKMPGEGRPTPRRRSLERRRQKERGSKTDGSGKNHRAEGGTRMDQPTDAAKKLPRHVSDLLMKEVCLG
jgi:hypothetical protein